jgi:hypothetical protein
MTRHRSFSAPSVSWTIAFGIGAVGIACSGPDFVAPPLPSQPGANTADVGPDAENIIICTQCEDPTLDAGNDATVDAMADGASLEATADGTASSSAAANVGASDAAVAPEVAPETLGPTTSCTPCATPAGGTESCDGTSCVAGCPGTSTLCSGDCVDLTSDGSNCGSCGHSCLGGLCSSSQCQPVTLGSDPNGNYVVATALDSTNLYWMNAQNAGANTGILYKCPLATGCTGGAQQLATNFPGGAAISPNLGVDATNLYWSNGSILECAINGCTTPMVYYTPPPGGTVLFVQSDGTNLYWSQINSSGGINEYYIYSCSLSGGCSGVPTTVMFGYQIQDMKLFSGSLYVSSSEPADGGSTLRILKCSTAAGCSNTPTVLFSTSPSTGGLRPLAVDSAHVYWYNSANKQLAECSSTACSAPTVLASTALSALFGASLAVDSTYVYWAGNGEIDKCAIGGCGQTPTPLMQGVSMPTVIGADATALYYTLSNGSAVEFHKLAK